MKKEYKAPSVRSIKINEPLAYACTIYNASSQDHGTWSGPRLWTEPVGNC